MRSTPTPEATLRTVKVAPASVPCLTDRTVPSNACLRTFLVMTSFLLACLVFFNSSIFCQTRTTSPDLMPKSLRSAIFTGDILTPDSIVCAQDFNTKYLKIQKGGIGVSVCRPARFCVLQKPQRRRAWRFLRTTD